MNNPLVSILIPVYNTEKYVAEAIESALNQTYKNIEIVIVDDGSTDRSWEIIESYREKYPNIIKTFKQENKGACAARNKAFELSTGQYIQYLDSDDLLAPDKIEHQIKYFDGSGEDELVVFGNWIVFKNNRLYPTDIEYFPDETLKKNLTPIEWFILNKSAYTSIWLTPRELIKKSNGWDITIRINQDSEFFTRVITLAKNLIYCKEAYCYYRFDTPRSIRKKNRDINMAKSYFKTCLTYESSLKKFESLYDINKALKKKYLDFIFIYYPYEKDFTKIAFSKVKNLKTRTELPGSPLQNLLVKMLGLKIGLRLYSIYYKLKYGNKFHLFDS